MTQIPGPTPAGSCGSYGEWLGSLQLGSQLAASTDAACAARPSLVLLWSLAIVAAFVLGVAGVFCYQCRESMREWLDPRAQRLCDYARRVATFVRESGQQSWARLTDCQVVWLASHPKQRRTQLVLLFALAWVLCIASGLLWYTHSTNPLNAQLDKLEENEQFAVRGPQGRSHATRT